MLTAASDRKFSSMKSALKRIFGEHTSTKEEEGIKIKQEEAFIAKNFSRYQRPSRPGTATSTNYQKSTWQQMTEQRGTNPLDRQGRRTRCVVCESVFHWAKHCPHKDQRREEIK